MADYLFVPQSVLDKWSEQGRIQVDGNVLTILGEQKSFTLTSAVRFIKMEAGDDNVGLLAKVKTTDALKQMGAGRAAAASQAAAAKSGSAPAPGAAPGAAVGKGTQDEKKGAEQDMLAQFLLDNLQ